MTIRGQSRPSPVPSPGRQQTSRLAVFLIVIWMVLVSARAFATPGDSPIGYWKSLSDPQEGGGKTTALWELSLDRNQVLQGTVIWAPALKEHKIYRSSNRDLDGLPVVGTFWMKGLKRQGENFWAGGTIVDVRNPKGEVYGCEIRLLDGGTKLELRGYLGSPLLGKTQVWVRPTEGEIQSLKG